MINLAEKINSAGTIGISGHIHPDGDCIGSCLALYNYILGMCAQTGAEKKVDIYLEAVPDEFKFLKNSDKINSTYPEMAEYDLFISLDCGSADRLGNAQKYFDNAKVKLCIDHHISNTYFADENHVIPDSSSTGEVLFDLFEEEMIDKQIAECLYVAIVHDTGVFKHSNTSEHTMNIAGKLLTKGAKSYEIIDRTFYEKTYIQNQVLGRCLLESMLLLDGRIIVSSISKYIQNFYGITSADLSGVIDQLRLTKGVEVAIFLVEQSTQVYKVSMRSNGVVDVSKIAVFFGGGGHIKAAGCTMYGSLHDVINNLTLGMEHQLKQNNRL